MHTAEYFIFRRTRASAVQFAGELLAAERVNSSQQKPGETDQDYASDYAWAVKRLLSSMSFGDFQARSYRDRTLGCSVLKQAG